MEFQILKPKSVSEPKNGLKIRSQKRREKWSISTKKRLQNPKPETPKKVASAWGIRACFRQGADALLRAASLRGALAEPLLISVAVAARQQVIAARLKMRKSNMFCVGMCTASASYIEAVLLAAYIILSSFVFF